MSLNINLITNNSNIPFDTTAPFSYNEWLQYNVTVSPDNSVDLYNEYLRKWYVVNSQDNQPQNAIKQDYINLLRELQFFFNEEEKNLFLKDIDFNNDVEIIYAIPFFVQKLKEIALSLVRKRHEIKSTKYEYNLIGTQEGVEQLLYNNFLKSFTKSSNTTHISLSTLSNIFPDLTSVNDSFSIQIEDLYDTSIYADQQNIPQIAINPLYKIFNDFVTQQTTQELPLSSYSNYTTAGNLNINNFAFANARYLGNTVYGITAIKQDRDNYDSITNLEISQGNNWFFWPSGEIYTDININQNIYNEIKINTATFTLSGATAGSNYTESDLIFTETYGNIEGAWLRGSTEVNSVSSMVMTAQPREIRSFIYPKPGYGLTTSYTWSGRTIDDEKLITFNLLDTDIKTNIIKKYFSSGVETDTIDTVFLNKTSLVNCSAHAGFTSLNGDNILQRPGGTYNSNLQVSGNGVYVDQEFTNSSFLYKITSTELLIDSSTNYILWPLLASSTMLDITSAQEMTDLSTQDICNNIYVNAVNTSQHFKGAIAGLDIDTSDVIYKISSSTSAPIEISWLNGGSVKTLATYNTYSMPVYATSAVNCVESVEGAIQPNLSIKCIPNNAVSFIWCDVDTYADEVFKYREHQADCPYILTTRNYIKDTTNTDWDKCTCKSVYYSPIGHMGDNLTDNYSAADCLFADPQNLGTDFTLNKWRDTRNYNYKISPQFAFFQKKNNNIDEIAGFGVGTWKTGTDTPMILRTGRRYTYLRSSLRNSSLNTDVPPLITYYPYKKIISSGISSINADIVLLIDISGSEYYSINRTKELATKITEYINTAQGSQISVVLFNDTSAVASYLTTSKEIIYNVLNDIDIIDREKNTNIVYGLDISFKILTDLFGVNKKSINALCSNLRLATETALNLSTTSNIPNADNEKIIILFSDGDDNYNKPNVIKEAERLRANNIKIISIDIGGNSPLNNIMESIAYTTEDYFNYEQALLLDDSNNTSETFANTIVSKIYKSTPSQPTWRRAILVDGQMISTNTPSDMSLQAGDIIVYKRQENASYSAFNTPAVEYIINVPLYGWNYDESKFDGVSLGAKPYWGVAFNAVNSPYFSTRFAREFGGNIYYKYDYIPMSHPKISNIKLSANDYIEYRNKGCNTLIWQQEIKFNTITAEKKWLKLKLCTQPASLTELFRNNSIDKIFEQTNEESDIVLKTYSDTTPIYYCYYANNRFLIKEPLYYKNSQTYSRILTGVVIEPFQPYSNLQNTFFPGVAIYPNLSSFTTYSKTGQYLLPTSLGIPYYLGHGSVNKLNITKLATLTGDRVFLDPLKYTSNRGLSKQDNLSPYETVFTDNTWIKEGASSGEKTGIIINARPYQKFVPYQTNYENYNFNVYGLSRQDDIFEFWTGESNNVWNDSVKYPTNYKKEPYLIEERSKNLLVTNKCMNVWHTDIYGNNYGIMKESEEMSYQQASHADGELWIRTVNNNIYSAPQCLSAIYDNYFNFTNFYNTLYYNSIIDIIIIKDMMYIYSSQGICINSFTYDISSDRFLYNSKTTNFIDLQNKTLIGTWYNEDVEDFYIVVGNITTDILYNKRNLFIKIYTYNIDSDVFKLYFEEIVDITDIETNIIGAAAIITSTSISFNSNTNLLNVALVLNQANILNINFKCLPDLIYTYTATLMH